jgi:hypothetical protein
VKEDTSEDFLIITLANAFKNSAFVVVMLHLTAW